MLDNAMDWGLSEYEFWNMTIAEIFRYIESKKRVQKQRSQEKAIFDYKLAELVGVSVSRIYSKSVSMPPIEEAYAAFFDKKEIEEQRQEKQDELSALRFKQFADAFNKKFRERREQV